MRILDGPGVLSPRGMIRVGWGMSGVSSPPPVDTTAPTISDAGFDVGTATASVTANEAGTVFVLVNDTEVTAKEAVAAGGGLASASGPLTANQAANVAVSIGSIPVGDHWVHTVVRDSAGNISDPTSLLYAFPGSVPAQFAASDWSVTDDGTGGAATITVASLPSAGSDPITDIEFQIGGGEWIGGGIGAPGFIDLTGLTNDVAVSIAIRAVSNAGAGPASATKSVTPTAPAAGAAVDNNGTAWFTMGSPAQDTATLDLAATFTLNADGQAHTLYECSGRSAVTINPDGTVYVRIESAPSGTLVYSKSSTETITVEDGEVTLVVSVDASAGTVSVKKNGTELTMPAWTAGAQTIQHVRTSTGFFAYSTGEQIVDMNVASLTFSTDGGTTNLVDLDASAGAAAWNDGSANTGTMTLTPQSATWSAV